MAPSRTTFTVDRTSFQLGMINCFAEMVACGVKKLAISPPLLPAEYRLLSPLSVTIVSCSGIKSYLEKSLLITDLQPAEFTAGKWSILYYKDDEVLEEYFALKERQGWLRAEGNYNETARRDISRAFMKLLSYPDDIIEARLSRSVPESPFILIQE